MIFVYFLLFVIKIMRRDEHISPFVSDVKRGYIFGGISSIAAIALIKVLPLITFIV